MADIEALRVLDLPGRPTTQDTNDSSSSDGEGFLARLQVGSARRTGITIDPDERGNPKARDVPGEGYSQAPEGERQFLGDDGEGARVRSEMARGLVSRVEQLLPLVGDVSLPAHIQLLKHDLSRCHDALRDHPAETDFLSIVTLLESAITQTRWKDYSHGQLEQMRSAIEVGYRQLHVTCDDYEQVRRRFAEGGVDTTPRIDLESLTPDELADDEEE